MTDMPAVLARYRAMLEPAGAGADHAYDRRRHSQRYADDSHAFLPGTWFMAGHHQGREEIDALWHAVRRMWPEGTRLFRNHFFVGEDTIAVEWWSRNRVWNGNRCRNSGVGRLRFRGDEVIDHHEITDSEYFEEVHGDWRAFLGRADGRLLPRWHDRERPFYPTPARNDWACEHSPTDGRAGVPPEMQEIFERVRAWWEDGVAAPDLLADDVDVFYQGRLWPLGGRFRGRAAWEQTGEVWQRLFRDERMRRVNLWAGEGRILAEWFAEKTRWDGERGRDGGFSVWDLADGRVTGIRTYLDTSFYAEWLEGWREVVGGALGETLPNWEVPEAPRYPRPAEHE